MSRPSTWGMLSEEMAEDAKEFFTEKSSGLHLPKVPKKKEAAVAVVEKGEEKAPSSQDLRAAARIEKVRRKTTISGATKIEGVAPERLREIEQMQKTKTMELGSVGSRLKAMRGLVKNS